MGIYRLFIRQSTVKIFWGKRVEVVGVRKAPFHAAALERSRKSIKCHCELLRLIPFSLESVLAESVGPLHS